MKIKGYFTSYSYWGWVGDKYMEFATEEEYLNYISKEDEEHDN